MKLTLQEAREFIANNQTNFIKPVICNIDKKEYLVQLYILPSCERAELTKLQHAVVDCNSIDQNIEWVTNKYKGDAFYIRFTYRNVNDITLNWAGQSKLYLWFSPSQTHQKNPL